MITAVDTSVLLDFFVADSQFGRASRSALRTCQAEGSLVACEIVWAEASSHFPDSEAASEALDSLEILYSTIDVAGALEAGRRWREYRLRGGPRSRATSDFLIAGHAVTKADRLLTRDRGFYRAYFQNLEILDPSRP